MKSEMARLQKKHACMKEGRAIGLFGMIDLQRNTRGEPFAPYASSSPPMVKLGKFFKERGLFTFVKNSGFTCIPPLCITEEELCLGYAIVDDALTMMDGEMSAT